MPADPRKILVKGNITSILFGYISSAFCKACCLALMEQAVMSKMLSSTVFFQIVLSTDKKFHVK